MGWRERTCMKQWSSLNGIPNYPSKRILQLRYDGSGIGWRGSTTELGFMGLSSGCRRTKALTLEWKNKGEGVAIG